MERCPYCFKPLAEGEKCDCRYEESKNVRIEEALRPGTVVGACYQIGGVMGQGGFGITYCGYDLDMQKIVAIKEFFPEGWVTRYGMMIGDENLSRTKMSHSVKTINTKNQDVFKKSLELFYREAVALGKLSKLPNVVHAYRIFRENNTAYIVMDYVEGQSLKDLLKERGHLTEQETLALLDPITAVLGKVHNEGILHRDIAPDNIMIDENGDPVLLDFGAARVEDGHQSSVVIGKKGYSSPEQISGGEHDKRSDIYALGATYYHALTGKRPQDSQLRALNDEVVAPHEIMPGISRKTSDAVMKAMSIRADDRFRDTDEFREALKAEEKPKRTVSKMNFLWIFPMLLLIFAAVFGAWKLMPVLFPNPVPTSPSMVQIQETATSLPAVNDADTPALSDTAVPAAIKTAVPTKTSKPTNTAVPTATKTAVPIKTPKPTNTAVPTATKTAVPTKTLKPTNTAAPTATKTAVPTKTPKPTNTAVPTATKTAVPTKTPKPTNTAVPTATKTAVPTKTPKPTNTAVPTATKTAVPTKTPRPTNTAVPTQTKIQYPSETPVQIRRGSVDYPGIGHYEGEMTGDKRTGQGKMSWFNGDVYEGTWKNDMADGSGIYIWANGITYAGEFKEDQIEGYGTVTISGFGTYEGKWKESKKNGQGKMTYDDGRIYEGEWKDDQKYGQGKMTWIDNRIYEGKWNDESGQGKITYPNGDVYEGTWINGKVNGNGVYTWNDGNRYEGQFKDDLMDGNGVFTRTDGWVFDGEWYIWSGQGKITFPNGDVYEGTWVNQKADGDGVYSWIDGSRYEGQFKDGLMDGYGVLTTADGRELKGDWKNGEFIRER